MTSASQTRVTLVVPAKPGRIFDLLATPYRLPEIDPSGSMVSDDNDSPVTAEGQDFVMHMVVKGGPEPVAYRARHHVNAFKHNRLIGWRVEPVDHDGAGGWSWRFDEHLSHIHSHHHGVDGLILTRTRDQTGTTSVRNVTCEFNGRQGCSLTGGRDLTFEQCKFGRTGKAGLLAAPGDGLDIEAESSPIRNATFSDCEFSDNGGFGVGAGKTDAADIRFLRCKLIGTQNWAAWPYAPKLEFDDCLFVGAIIHAYGDPDQARAAKFIRSTFTDDPSLSPTGKVFIGRGGLRSIAVVRDGPNVLFDRCRFNLIGDALLPQTRPDTIFQSCIMSQRSAVISHPVGRYTGTCTIIGNANLAGSAIDGTVTLNGRRL